MVTDTGSDPITDHAGNGSLAAARKKVALLDAQAEGLRAELLELQKQLHSLENDLTVRRASELREANQKLVLAVLQADRIAEVAVASLAEVAESQHRDELTGISNRTLGLDRLKSGIALARRHGNRLAVLFFDIDNFKAINDTLGHAIGDQVLQLVTKRLQAALRDSDTISRYGGDELLVILLDVSTASDVARIAEELLAALANPSRVGKHTLQLSASLGISLYPDDGEDAATLIDRADAAMYRCKRSGAGGFQFYTKDDVDDAPHDLLLGPVRRPATSNVDGPTWSTSLQQDLREANEQLVMSALLAQESEALAKKAYREQLAFMAMVAHELRNPLAPLRLATDMLTNPSPDDEISTDRLREIITSQVARMARLVDDLLDGSRLSAGKLRLEFDVVDLVSVLDQVIMTCRPGMEKRQQQLSVQLLPAPIIVRGDLIRLTQIFASLLDNASKYTPEGGEIKLGMTVAEQSISISVRDNGFGITAEMLPLIFGMFVQDVRTLPHSSGGLGIGLAVVHELVAAHGGTVVAHSAGSDLGSEFVVTLPLS